MEGFAGLNAYNPEIIDTSFSSVKKKKTSISIEKKAQISPNNVFGGLKAAAPDLHLTRRLQAEHRNISPHAHERHQKNPNIRQLAANQQNQLSFGQFYDRKSTIQHENSIQVDDKHAKETMKVLNVDVQNFKYSEHESTNFFNRKDIQTGATVKRGPSPL